LSTCGYRNIGTYIDSTYMKGLDIHMFVFGYALDGKIETFKIYSSATAKGTILTMRKG
jgi:hypothetical protein